MSEEQVQAEQQATPEVVNVEATAVNPIVVQLLQVLINAEPRVIQAIANLYPNNPVVQEAVALQAQILPILQQIETILAGQ